MPLRTTAPPAPADPPFPPGRLRSLVALAVAELLSISMWFSASAVGPRLALERGLDEGGVAWLTMAVQLGFVAGALLSAAVGLADRLPAPRLLAAGAALGALANAAVALPGVGAEGTILLRALTGACLAAVYPPGMKIVASWTRGDRGAWIGLLVGALAIGSAGPHLLGALTLGEGVAWRPVLLGSSLLSLAAAGIAATLVRAGPLLPRAARFRPRHALEGLRSRPVRLANFGYFGHMWELYAAWTWVPLLLLESFEAAGHGALAGRLAGFAFVAAGGVGSALAGRWADRWGRTVVTGASLAVSGLCALAAGWLIGAPWALAALALVWGFAVVADSAQFSAAVSELSDPAFVGTALTVQTSLGFLLTLVSIRLVPPLADAAGWGVALGALALGPAAGLAAMLRLRALPEATRMAGGRR